MNPLLGFLFALLLSTLLPSHSVLATKAYCGAVCESASQRFLYQLCSTTTTYYGCHCRIPAFLGTFSLCIQDWCDGSDSHWKTLVRDCSRYDTQIASYQDILSNATQFIQPLPTNLTETIYAPVRIPDALWHRIYHSSSTFYFNLRDGTLFGWAIAVLSGITCLLAGVRHLYLSRPHISHSSSLDGAASPGRSSPVTVYIKKHLLMPAFIGKPNARRPSVVRITFSIPTRLQSILLVCYVGLNVVAVCVRYTLFLDNTLWPGDKSAQLMRYVADRSGILAFANIPLLIAFAGRNNLLIWLTGSSFVTFNIFHKWIGRVCVAHAVIHSVAYTVIYWRVNGGGAAAVNLAYLEPYLRWGALATTAGALLLFQAIHIFRLRAYETFLILHIVLSIIFIIGCWYHVHLIPYDIYMPWLYASVALWAFDRAVRVVRIVWWNVRWSRREGWKVTRAAVTVLEGGFVRLDVKPVKGWKVVPGQYVYLYVLGSMKERPWENHPFTIYDYHFPGDVSSPASDGQEKKRALDSPSSPSPSPGSSIRSDNATITLYIRPYNGMTSRLSSLAQQPQLSEKSSANSQTHPILIEGPYGHGLPLHNFDNITLIAGGVGVTALIPYFNHHLSSERRRQRVHLIWILRDMSNLNGIIQDILAHSSSSHTVSIYITSQHKSASESDRLLPDLERDSNITLHTERPSCAALLAEEAETAMGSLAVVACGPGGLMDDCRAACVELVDRKRGTVEFFSEEFGW